jgi:hypothetical protein
MLAFELPPDIIPQPTILLQGLFHPAQMLQLRRLIKLGNNQHILPIHQLLLLIVAQLLKLGQIVLNKPHSMTGILERPAMLSLTGENRTHIKIAI